MVTFLSEILLPAFKKIYTEMPSTLPYIITASFMDCLKSKTHHFLQFSFALNPLSYQQ